MIYVADTHAMEVAFMLYSVERSEYINRIPHASDFRQWTSRLSPAEMAAIKRELNRRIRGGEVHTAGWIPGSDWRGTVYQPIWDTACRYDQSAAALCFGLILWQVMMEHPDTWSFGRYTLRNVPIRSLTYFGIQPPE